MIDYTDFPTVVYTTLEDERSGFDLDLVGFDCNRELTADLVDVPREQWPPWRCPFDPGCGAVTWRQCPLMARHAMISRAPARVQ